MNEAWVDTYISDKYEVSSLGHVRHKVYKRILKPQLNKPNGYYMVRIDGRYIMVHRLVYASFYDCDIDSMDIYHLDGNKRNNFVGNLVCGSRQTSMDYGLEHGYVSRKSRTTRTVTTCEFCKNRFKFDVCYGRSLDFYCSYGEPKD